MIKLKFGFRARHVRWLAAVVMFLSVAAESTGAGLVFLWDLLTRRRFQQIHRFKPQWNRVSSPRSTFQTETASLTFWLTLCASLIVQQRLTFSSRPNTLDCYRSTSWPGISGVQCFHPATPDAATCAATHQHWHQWFSSNTTTTMSRDSHWISSTVWVAGYHPI